MQFSEVVLATSAAKIAVEVGVQSGIALTALDGGANGVIDLGASGFVNKVETVDGVITATAIAGLDDLDGDPAEYVLTPSVSNNQVQWTVSGSCVAAGLC